MRKFQIIVLSIFFGLGVFAQNETLNGLYIEGNYQYGFIWQHDPSLVDIIDGNINIFQLNLEKKSTGQSYWDQLYRYPYIGIGFYYADLGNSVELGLATAIYAYIKVPLITKNNFQASYRVSGGLSYLNRNVAIGSLLNCYIDASVETQIKLGKQLLLINSFGATHFSNGAIRKPNLGLNLFSYRLGFNYKIDEVNPIKTNQELPEINKKNYIVTTLNYGLKELDKFNNERYNVFSGVADYQRRLGYRYKIGMGLDLFYDESLFMLMDTESVSNLSSLDIMRYGVHISTEARIYNLMVAFHLGTYLHAGYIEDGAIYQRVAIRYLLSETIFTNISIKASDGVADFVEWGIGYQFKW